MKEQIVYKAQKVDFHIHSIYSSHKDKGKVQSNTPENLKVLISRLNSNEVSICSITDHDVFSYELYTNLKNEEGIGSISKVLPGVEFSVKFIDEKSNSNTIHVVAIFDDKNSVKVQQIEGIVGKDQPKYPKDKEYYNEKEFLEILREINLDVVLIAHQKNTIKSKKGRDNDATSVSREMFDEFLFSQYFEAYEFRNKRNELFNKKYIAENEYADVLRFVTGSDCHDWNHYPKYDSKDLTDHAFTFMKCLPTFRGVVMCFTDYRRIKLVNSFFTVSDKYLDNIELNINGTEYKIPLSKGINVIIGDNSIGKSLLLHALTDYRKMKEDKAKKTVFQGYRRYLKENHIIVNSKISTESLLLFDSQGEIREKFEMKKFGDQFLKSLFHEAVDYETYRILLEQQINDLLKAIRLSYRCTELYESLSSISCKVDYQGSRSLNIVGGPLQDILTVTQLNDKIQSFKTLDASIDEILKKILSKDESEFFMNIKLDLRKFIDNNAQLKLQVEKENRIINVVNTKSKKMSERLTETSTDYQKMVSSIKGAISENKRIMIELFSSQYHQVDFVPTLTETNLQIYVNRVNMYNFVTRCKITEINNEYFISTIRSILKKQSILHTSNITKKQLHEMISHFNGNEEMPEEFFAQKLRARFADDLEVYNVINTGDSSSDLYKELSSGFNQTMYFDLLCYLAEKPGIYLIDQPEDNVSQKSISNNLLDRFKTMSENRQIIMITHNPQFIINLDVDNVVFLGNEDGIFTVKSGAIEYEDDDDSILNIVVNNIEGGMNALRKRWKRYEKNADI